MQHWCWVCGDVLSSAEVYSGSAALYCLLLFLYTALQHLLQFDGRRRWWSRLWFALCFVVLVACS